MAFVSRTAVNAIAARQPFRAPAKARATALLRSLKGELAALGISEVWLFGSVARGDDGPDSDIAIKVGEGQKYASVVKFSAARLLQQRLGRLWTWPCCRSANAWRPWPAKTWSE